MQAIAQGLQGRRDAHLGRGRDAGHAAGDILGTISRTAGAVFRLSLNEQNTQTERNRMDGTGMREGREGVAFRSRQLDRLTALQAEWSVCCDLLLRRPTSFT